MPSLREAAKRHGVRLLGAPQATAWSMVSLGEWKGKEVYLKVLNPNSDERLAPALLEAWRRGPVVRILEASDSVHILERLSPGTSLEGEYDTLGDERSLLVLADIASTLRRIGANNIGYPEARGRGQSLLFRRRPVCIEEPLWAEAIRRYSALADSQHNVGVVHGDLHHYNVLRDNVRGWVAIDPKGVVAELEFEMACALRNPIFRAQQWSTPPQLARRAKMLAQKLGINESRLLGWSFAQSVVAAAWDVEDEIDPTPWINLARAYVTLLEARV